MGYAARGTWLKGSTQEMFQEQDRGIYKGKGVESHSLLLHFWSIRLLDTYTETKPKVFSHSSLHRLLNRCRYCHSPSQEDILTCSPTCKRELLPPAFSPTVPRRQAPQWATYNLMNMALWFPEFLQSILCLQ